jgi:hypothetical protein
MRAKSAQGSPKRERRRLWIKRGQRCSTWVVNSHQVEERNVIFYLIDQREWPFILPGPRTRAWREMWHEMLEFQSGEVPEERYVLALAVNCRNKKYQIPCHQPLSPGGSAQTHIHISHENSMEGSWRCQSTQYAAPSNCHNIQGSPPRQVYARSQLPASPTSLERRRAANCGSSARIVIQGSGL